MARHEHLPIYKEAYDLALYFEKAVRGFSQYDKYLLESARRTGIPKIVLVREAEAGAGPVIPRIPAAVGRIGARCLTGESWIRTRRAAIGMSPKAR